MNAMVATVALAASWSYDAEVYAILNDFMSQLLSNPGALRVSEDGATHGALLTCGTDEALTGVCTSGRYKDCAEGTSHRIRCMGKNTDDLFGDKGQHPWIEKKWGQWATCPEGSIAIGRCASGTNADCKAESDDSWHHALRCQKLRSNWRVLETGSKWLCGKYGVDIACPLGYVVTKSCGSGENNDCDNLGCVGKDAWSGLRCNLLVDDGDVRLSSKSPAGTVSVRVARPADNVESPLGQDVCDLVYHRAVGEETYTFSSQYEMEEGFEVTTTASSSQQLSVEQKWTSSIGVSKGPFSASFGSETTFAGEWTTSSEVVETSTMRRVTKGSVEREMALPANAYVARANFVVLATLTASVSADLSRLAFTTAIYTDEAEVDYRQVSPAAYSLVVDLVDHPNLIGVSSCEAFVTELFTSGTINKLNAGLHRL